LAVHRAQTLVLQVDGRGTWLLMPLSDTTTIGRGTVEPPTGAVRLRLSPLGVCLAEGALPAGGWDALACAHAGEGDRR
jgi:hypothetical protein